MTTECHPRHARLAGLIEAYLADANKSARWLGWRVADDPRLVANLRRGQFVPLETMQALWQRIGATPVEVAPSLEKGSLVRFVHGQDDNLQGEVCGIRDSKNGRWVAILYSRGEVLRVVRVRAQSVLAEIAPERPPENPPAALAA